MIPMNGFKNWQQQSERKRSEKRGPPSDLVSYNSDAAASGLPATVRYFLFKAIQFSPTAYLSVRVYSIDTVSLDRPFRQSLQSLRCSEPQKTSLIPAAWSVVSQSVRAILYVRPHGMLSFFCLPSGRCSFFMRRVIVV